MVTVSGVTTDSAVAWRIRDELAHHPLLGGATASIEITASHESVVLKGWTHDEDLIVLAVRLAGRVAGRRSIHPQLNARRCAASQADQDSDQVVPIAKPSIMNACR